MSDNPFDLLPPAPDDLWPQVSSLKPARLSLATEAFPAPLSDVAEILGRAVHLEMQSSGEYAAKAAMPPVNLPLYQAHLRGVELRFHARRHAESAARLLHLYGAIHAETDRQKPSSLPAPTQLKEAATRTYRMAVRDEIALQYQIRVLKGEQPSFNDELYGQLKTKLPGHGAKFQRQRP
jgi:hypothetical protein